MTYKTASIYAIFYVQQNACISLSFFILCNFDFYFLKVMLVYVNIDQGIHKVKLKVAQNEKGKKNTKFFYTCGIKFSTNPLFLKKSGN